MLTTTSCTFTKLKQGKMKVDCYRSRAHPFKTLHSRGLERILANVENAIWALVIVELYPKTCENSTRVSKCSICCKRERESTNKIYYRSVVTNFN